MKAAVWTDIGKVEIMETPTPEPKPYEVRVKVKSAGICATDLHVISGGFKYSTPPHILGHEIAGEVESLGHKVLGWNVGDRVVVDTTLNCGNCYFCRRGLPQFCLRGGEIGQSPHQGGYAQYLCVPAECLRKLPDEISDDEAGIMESVLCPAGSILKLGIRLGDTVLVQGAGPAGLAYIQAAKAGGAGKVIVAARNEFRLAQARSFGATVTIDILKENIEQRVMEETEGRGVDVSIEAAGYPSSINYAVALAAKNGSVILYGIPGDDERIQFPITEIILKQLSLHGACSNPHAWEAVIQLTAQGRFNLKDMVTHRFPLEEFNRAAEVVQNRRDGVIKAVLHPHL